MYRMGLEGDISHAVAQRLLFAEIVKMDEKETEEYVQEYVTDFRTLFSNMGADKELIEGIIENGTSSGRLEFAMGQIPQEGSGAQMRPEDKEHLVLSMRQLQELLQAYKRHLEREIAASKEE